MSFRQLTNPLHSRRVFVLHIRFFILIDKKFKSLFQRIFAIFFMFCTTAVSKRCSETISFPRMRQSRRPCSSLDSAKLRSIFSFHFTYIFLTSLVFYNNFSLDARQTSCYNRINYHYYYLYEIIFYFLGGHCNDRFVVYVFDPK